MFQGAHSRYTPPPRALDHRRSVREAHGAQPRQVKVHFQGWGSRYDEWITAGSGRIASLPLRMTCVEGDRLQACDSKGIWCEAKVLDVREAQGADARKMKVHFFGWKSRYDEWIPVNTGRLCP